MGNEVEKSKATQNPFVQALRGRNGKNDVVKADAGSDQMVRATVEAMDLGGSPAVDEPGGVAAAGSSAVAPDRPAADGGRMEAVVDLLFGNHLTEINASMRALEKQLTERVAKAEGEMSARIESIDRHAKGEIEALNKLVERECEKRDAALGKMSDRIGSTAQQLELRLDKVEGDFKSTHEAAQKEVDERLTSAVATTADLRQGMEREIADMKATLSTRSELGAMFGELGKRLDANIGAVG